MRISVGLLVILLTGCGTLRPEEIPWQALNIVDTVQALNMDHSCQYEKNPLLSAHPSDAEFAAWSLAFGVGYHYLSKWVCENHPGGCIPFNVVSTVIKGAVVVHNAKLDGC